MFFSSILGLVGNNTYTHFVLNVFRNVHAKYTVIQKKVVYNIRLARVLAFLCICVTWIINTTYTGKVHTCTFTYKHSIPRFRKIITYYVIYKLLHR